ncbi:MAG: outer membrane protein assembly factor BamD [Oligoflexus sp.]
MRQKHQAIKCLFFFVFSFALFISCVEKDFNPDDPAEAFAAARQPYDDKLYDIAIQRLGGFKSRFPYSKHAPLAELYMANSHFELRQYQEAAMSYEQFVRLYPRHEEVPFAMYRIGESYWIEAPEAIDREQDFTLQAIDEWQKLVRRFPESKYASDAKEFIKKGERRIAESFNFVVNFYCRQELWHACAYKAIQLIDKYPDFADLRLNALNKAAISFEHMAKLKAKDPESDKNIFFRTMTAEELAERGNNFRELAKKLKKSS